MGGGDGIESVQSNLILAGDGRVALAAVLGGGSVSRRSRRKCNNSEILQVGEKMNEQEGCELIPMQDPKCF